MADATRPRMIRYRKAKPADIGAIKELLNKHLANGGYPDEFYEKVAVGLQTGNLGDGKTDLMSVVAIDDGHLVGTIMISTMNLAEAKDKNKLTFDVLEKTAQSTKAAYIMTMAVLPVYRRRGIGKELIYEGLRRTIEADKNIECSFLHCEASDDVANSFYEDAGYTLMGEIPEYYSLKVEGSDGKVREAKEAAHVWARPFHDGVLAVYQPTKTVEGKAVINLADPELKRVKKMPQWMVDCGFQFLLPLCIVALLFIVSYILVLLGPLKGISRKYMKDGGAADDLDSDLDPLSNDVDENGEL